MPPKRKWDEQGTLDQSGNNNNNNNNDSNADAKRRYLTRSAGEITPAQFKVLLEQDNPNAGKDPNLGGPFADLRRKIGIALCIDDKSVEKELLDLLKHPERIQKSPVKVTPTKMHARSDSGKEFHLAKKIKMCLNDGKPFELVTYELNSPQKNKSEATPTANRVSTTFGEFSEETQAKIKQYIQENKIHEKIPVQLADPATHKKNYGRVLFNNKIRIEANKVLDKRRGTTQNTVMRGISAEAYARLHCFTNLKDTDGNSLMVWCHDVPAHHNGPVCIESVKEERKGNNIKKKLVYTPFEKQDKENIDPNKGEVRNAQVPHNLYVATKACNTQERILEMFESLLSKLGYEVYITKDKKTLDFAPHMAIEVHYTIEWGKLNDKKEFVRHGKLEQTIDALSHILPTCDDYNILITAFEWFKQKQQSSTAKIARTLSENNPLPASIPPLLDLTQSELDEISISAECFDEEKPFGVVESDLGEMLTAETSWSDSKFDLSSPKEFWFPVDLVSTITNKLATSESEPLEINDVFQAPTIKL